MSLKVFRSNPLIKYDESKKYFPVFTVINRKIYKTDNWNELFKILMYSYCYKSNNMDVVLRDVNIKQQKYKNEILISDEVEESSRYTKFSPDLYIRVFTKDYNNLILLNRIRNYINKKDFSVYLAKYDDENDLDDCENIIAAKISEVKEINNYKNGSTKYFIAHINGSVLNTNEKFYRRIEKAFDQKTLIGDIEIKNDEQLLNAYMRRTINMVIDRDIVTIPHEKVFAFGLVRAALKNYASKTFWPYLDAEYNVKIPVNQQWKINDQFRRIMKEYNKLYDDTSSNFIQNICMHAFVCNRCADQFFDYMFDFWRIDLSRSLENSVDDNGVDLFEILIEEISKSVQDIMIHTTMALQQNPVGSKNRFRRILKMIDESYWANADYSSSKNRMTLLFNEWKNNPNGPFMKEFRKTIEGRKKGRGEKLLSRPTIIYDPRKTAFSLVLPKQILRNCTEEEHPYWKIKIDDIAYDIEPLLMKGRAFLFTEECTIPLEADQLFDEIEVVLKSERENYYNKTLKADEVRFFNSHHRNIEIADDYISRDVVSVFCAKNSKITYLNGAFSGSNTSADDYDYYEIKPEVGDVLILPSGHALSIGKPLSEGIISNSRVDGVHAISEEVQYQIAADSERLFFKATKKRFNGSSIKIFHHGELVKFGKVADNQYIEFKLDESLKDIYGYIIDFHDYVSQNGIYDVELSIPGGSIRVYKVCYIRHFSYEYVGAPYYFKNTAKIKSPNYLSIETNDDWSVFSDYTQLEFTVSESERDENTYVWDQKLHLNYKLKKETIELEFDLPVLYWKYNKDSEWLIQQPEDTMVKSLPNNIYISGALPIASAKMFISNADDLEESEIIINYDSKSNLYYFRTADLVEMLNRDVAVRNVYIDLNGEKAKFFSVVCKSIVRSQSITGDFLNRTIFGYFDILGSSDYSVTIKHKDEIIEEDISVENGRFEVECDVEEGEYTVILYEIEDDDSGFGSISYELGTYDLQIIDPSNFEGKNISIRYIRDRKMRFADLSIRDGYVIRKLQKLNYTDDIDGNIDVYSWNYTEEELEAFTYYKGVFGSTAYSKGFVKIGDILVVLDNSQNINEVFINTIDEDECSSLLYDSEKQMLHVTDDGLPKQIRRRLTPIDDDVYKIGIEVEG